MSKRIPIKALDAFAKEYKKDQVITICWSKADGLTWVTTYGKTTEDCDQAAQGGNWLKKNFLSWPNAECVAEPHRVKKLKRACKAALHAIESVLAHRTGITDDLLISIREALKDALK